MPNERIYLDHNATTPLLDDARLAMVDCLTSVGNASSIHKEGREAKRVIERSRSQVAKLAGAKPANVIFTASASEAATHALSPDIRAGGHSLQVSKLYVSAVEHPCVLGGGRFSEVDKITVPVRETGLIDLAALDQMLLEHDRSAGFAMVAAQYANSETGILQPIAEVSRICAAHDAFLLVDAVQAFAKLPISVETMGAHFVIVSAHKIGGPLGAGALILRDGSISPAPLIKGSQENYHRGGTENVASIAGFGAACDWHAANTSAFDRIREMRARLETGLSVIAGDNQDLGRPVIFGEQVERLPNTSCFATPGVKAETALIALDLSGISVSSGSACSSGKVGRSHVLDSMGVSDDLSACALRVSMGTGSEVGDTDRFIEAYKNIVRNAA